MLTCFVCTRRAASVKVRRTYYCRPCARQELKQAQRTARMFKQALTQKGSRRTKPIFNAEVYA